MDYRVRSFRSSLLFFRDVILFASVPSVGVLDFFLGLYLCHDLFPVLTFIMFVLFFYLLFLSRSLVSFCSLVSLSRFCLQDSYHFAQT